MYPALSKTFISLLALCLISCSTQVDTSADSSRNTILTMDDPRNLPLINELGDTIPTGVPIHVQGERIRLESIAELTTKPIPNSPYEVPLRTQQVPILPSRVIEVPPSLPVHIPGKNGVTIPKTRPVNTFTQPVIQPEPIPALPLVRKDQATLDIQSVSKEQALGSISDMITDQKGNIWLAGQEGLFRYDGHSFTHFSDSEVFLEKEISTLKEDHQGNIWMISNGNLSCYDGEYITYYGYNDDELSPFFLTDLIEVDAQGHIWTVGQVGDNVGVHDLDPVSKQITSYSRADGLHINRILSILLEDQKGNHWFGGMGGVTRFTPKQGEKGTFTHFTRKQGFPLVGVASIKEDLEGNIWFGGMEGLVKYDGNTFIHYPKMGWDKARYSNIQLVDTKGNLWITETSPNGERLVYCFDGTSLIHVSELEGLEYKNVVSIIEDPQGGIWFSSFLPEGLSRLRINGIRHFTTQDGLIDNGIWALTEDHQGHIWIGAKLYGVDGKGVSRLEERETGGTFYHYTKENGFNRLNHRSFYTDRAGNIWFGHYRFFLSVYNPERGSITHFNPKYEEAFSWRFWNMLEDRAGNMWFVGTNAIIQYDGTYWTTFSNKLGLEVVIVFSVLEDKKGTLWFGTSDGGLLRFEPDESDSGGDFTHFTQKEGLVGNTVLPLVEDRNGHIWIGTTMGLSVYDGKRFISFTEKNGLHHNRITSITKDQEDRMWVTTKKGISLFVPGDTSGTMTTIPGYRYFTFGLKDGAKSNSYNPFSSLLDSNNRIWWGTADGLIRWDLNEFTLPQSAPEHLQFTQLDLQGQFIDFKQLRDTSYSHTLSFGKDLKGTFDSVAAFYNYPLNLKLPHHINHLTFHFSAIDWKAPHKIQYSFKIEGIDKDWSLPSPEAVADYRNLAHGTYTLHVKAKGEAQIWSEPISYTFTIRPPWWLSPLAIVSYVLLFLTALYVTYRYLLNRRLIAEEARRIKELDEVKSRFYTNITHEFRTPLTIIQGVNDQISEHDKETSLIRKHSRHLLTLINQILDLSKLESNSLPINLIQGDIISYSKYLMDSFESLARSKELSLHFLSSEEEILMDIDPDKWQMILSNLISNAIKFTPTGGHIYLNIHQKSTKQLEVRVKDTGIGIPKDRLPYIFDRFYQVEDSSTRKEEGSGIGLALTQELIQVLGGTIEVKSTPGKGTEFNIKMPVTRQAPLKENMPVLIEEPSLSVEENGVDIPPLVQDLTTLGEDTQTILIVEDNEDVRGFIYSILKHSYTLLTAVNGEEGIKMAIEHSPDLVISDVMMPLKDGFELCQTLKEDLRTNHIPIILLTAKADIESKLAGLTFGADAYLPKPFDKKELRIRIEKLMELRSKLQEKYHSQSYLSAQNGEIPEATPEEKFVQSFKDIVEEHLSDPELNVHKLCRLMGMSRTQLHNKVKAITGQSTTQFVKSIRLAKASGLLLTTYQSISEIAYETGFQSASYFSQSFSKVYELSPSDYREKHQTPS